MAITPTGNIYKSFTFDGEDSRDYGVYITGSAVFDAPTRDVEMIDIPGRNGAYALDNGRFNNIEVTYPAGLFAESEADFAQAISELRNALCSRRGYCRLEDEYNPGEYRMAVYKSGLEVSPAQLKAGEFSITFDCKPQRFLTSGEAAISVSDGDTVTNPTLFESAPLLEVEGYGDIAINGETISIDDTVIGEVKLVSGDSTLSIYNNVKTFSEDALRAGDSITLDATDIEATIGSLNGATITGISGSPYIAQGSTLVKQATPSTGYTTGDPYPYLRIYATLKPLQFTAGSSSSYTIRIEQGATYVKGGPDTPFNMFVNITVSYTSGRISITCTVTTSELSEFVDKKPLYKMGAVSAYSSKSALGTPLYFDLDIGEAYKYESGEVVSVNNAVFIPAKLPTLKPGANVITYTQDVDSLNVIPRWWEV